LTRNALGFSLLGDFFVCFWLFFPAMFCYKYFVLTGAQLALAQRDEKSVQDNGGGLSGLYLSLAV